MIARHTVKCPGCGARIRLRLGIGLDEVQPFYFVCGRCNAATKGKITIWYDPTPGHRFELEDGEEIEDVESPDQAVTIHPDFPSVPDARELADRGGSSFNFFFALLGKGYAGFDRSLRTFRSVCDTDWPKVKRLMGYYLDANWGQFETEGKRFFEEHWPNPIKDWHRHDFMQNFLELATAPLWVEGHYPHMKAEFNYKLSASPERMPALKRFAQRCIRGGEIAVCQRDVFHCLSLYIDNRGGILPALPVLVTPAKKRGELAGLRLFRDDFAVLRDLYVATFEACHRVLKYVVAIVNIVDRGNPNDFGVSKPSRLSKFENMPSARKAQFLKALPLWERDWPVLLDRGIRNAVSHHSVRHDLPSGMLIARDAKPIPYVGFVTKTLRLVHAILLAAQVLKMVHIIDTLGNDDCGG